MLRAPSRLLSFATGRRTMTIPTPTPTPKCGNVSRFATAPNSNIIKDVILYSHDNKRFFRLLNTCALIQYFFWGYFAHFCFYEMKDTPINKEAITEDTPWYKKINLGENKYRKTLGTCSLIIGFGGLGLAWGYTLRSVRLLVLHKGGRDVSLVTFNPLGRDRVHKTALSDVSCQYSRTQSRVNLPIKVKNKLWYYMLDMRGTFRNPILFDNTAGLKRKLK